MTQGAMVDGDLQRSSRSEGRAAWPRVGVIPGALGVAGAAADRGLGERGGTSPPRGDRARRSDEILSLIESHGLTGAWSWHFASDEHVWSPGCFHLLGLDPREVRPSYDLLLRLVHPEDRCALARAPDLMRGEAASSQTFRIIRPDGTKRILRSRSDLKFSADGKPRCALGTLLDVTDRERDRQVGLSHRQSMEALDRKAGVLRFTMNLGYGFDFEPASADLLGVALRTLNADPFAGMEARERAEIMQAVATCQASGDDVVRDIVLRLPGKPPLPCRMIMIPAARSQRDAAGWHGTLQIQNRTDAPGPAGDQGLDDSLSGFHLRAARALLDWSMEDLAVASSLSLSTVRRIEADDPSRPVRSRRGAISALRRAGVAFLPLQDGTVAVARTG